MKSHVPSTAALLPDLESRLREERVPEPACPLLSYIKHLTLAPLCPPAPRQALTPGQLNPITHLVWPQGSCRSLPVLLAPRGCPPMSRIGLGKGEAKAPGPPHPLLRTFVPPQGPASRGMDRNPLFLVPLLPDLQRGLSWGHESRQPWPGPWECPQQQFCLDYSLLGSPSGALCHLKWGVAPNLYCLMLAVSKQNPHPRGGILAAPPAKHWVAQPPAPVTRQPSPLPQPSRSRHPPLPPFPPQQSRGPGCTREGPGGNEVVQAGGPAEVGTSVVCVEHPPPTARLGGQPVQVPTERPCSCSQENRLPVSVSEQTRPQMRSLEPASLPTAAAWS